MVIILYNYYYLYYYFKQLLQISYNYLLELNRTVISLEFQYFMNL